MYDVIINIRSPLFRRGTKQRPLPSTGGGFQRSRVQPRFQALLRKTAEKRGFVIDVSSDVYLSTSHETETRRHEDRMFRLRGLSLLLAGSEALRTVSNEVSDFVSASQTPWDW